MAMAGPTLHIDLTAIVANWRMFASRASQASVAAVVKADAYGLGAGPVAQALAKAGCSRFYVAWPHEGSALRRWLGGGPEISVFHGPTSDTMAVFADDHLVPVLNHPEQIRMWMSDMNSERPAAIHVDTGMNRLGLCEADWRAAAQVMTHPHRLISHLACADEDSPLNQQQLEAFHRACSLWPVSERSLAATAGTYLGANYHFDEIRPGIGLYGGGPIPPAGARPEPVIRLTAPVLQVRRVRTGQSVGYGASWTATCDSDLATVGLGYADGFLRAASNRGFVRICGQSRPVVGRVSMDLTIIDVTGLSVSPGDRVELIGTEMPLAQTARFMDTIDYEVLVRLGARLDRHYLGKE